MKPETDTPRILIVEDEPIVAMDISGRLTHLGYAVAGTVATGEGAIALAQQTQPDLVLLDIRLRGPMTGIEAAEQIRQRFGYPVVFLTAYAEDDTLKRASQANPLGYVLKPFGDRELKTAIEMALYRHRTEDKLSWDAAVTAALAALYAPLISPESSLDTMAQEVLQRAQTLTGSGHGFVSMINPVNHENVALALTGMMQDGSCLIEGKVRQIAFPRGTDGRYPALWGEALNTR